MVRNAEKIVFRRPGRKGDGIEMCKGQQLKVGMQRRGGEMLRAEAQIENRMEGYMRNKASVPH